MQEYSYQVQVYGASKTEEQEIQRLVEKTRMFQEKGDRWTDADMEEFMINLSADHLHLLFVIVECYTDELGNTTTETAYYGQGLKQLARDHYFKDAMEESLLPANFDRNQLPSSRLYSGEITVTGDGGLYRIKPYRDYEDIHLIITFEQDGKHESFLAPVTDLRKHRKQQIQ